MSNANPSLDPANNDNLTGMLRHVFNKLLEQVDGVLPAKVIAFDRNKNLAQVQPLIDLVTTNNEQISRSQIASVPVYQIGGGGFILNFNLQPGDQGLLIACDRDISLFTQSGNQSIPNTLRKKNFSDSFFLPMVLKGYTINGEDTTNAVFQNLDGTVRISLWSDKIKLTAPTVEIDGDLIVTGQASIDGEVNMNDRLIVQGNIASGGDITAAGTITPGVPIPP